MLVLIPIPASLNNHLYGAVLTAVIIGARLAMRLLKTLLLTATTSDVDVGAGTAEDDSDMDEEAVASTTVTTEEGGVGGEEALASAAAVEDD